MITIELEIEDINKVLTGLGELKAREVIDLIVSIRQQATPQLEAAALVDENITE